MKTSNSTEKESLGYVCKATVQRHGMAGFLYRNIWATGHQGLVFATHEAAKQWAESHHAKGVVCIYTGPANSTRP